MIKQLSIENFQSHRKTVLDLVDGLNVITGTSDNGKSSVIRALRWVVCNRPQGLDFHSNFAGEKEKTIVEIQMDEGVIARIKNKSANYYLIDDIEFHALRSDVPEEIKQVLRMDELNIQGQFDPYFLLQSSPGEVAKKLNEFCGLEIIDSMLSKINSLIIDSTQNIRNSQKEKLDIEEELKKYKNTEFVDKILKELEQLIKERDILKTHILALYGMKHILETTESIIKDYDYWLEVETSFQTIQTYILYYDRSLLQTMLCRNIFREHLKYTIDTFEILEAEESIHKLLTRVELCVILKKQVQKIKELKSNFSAATDDVKNLILTVISKEELFYKTLKENQVCPLCERGVLI